MRQWRCAIIVRSCLSFSNSVWWPGNSGVQAGRCLSFWWWLWLPSSHSETEYQVAGGGRHTATATFLSLIGPEKSKRWVALAVLVRLVTKLTSIVNHRNTQFSRPSRGGEFWKPVLLFGSTKVNNSFTPWHGLSDFRILYSVLHIWSLTCTENQIALVTRLEPK